MPDLQLRCSRSDLVVTEPEQKQQSKKYTAEPPRIALYINLFNIHIYIHTYVPRCIHACMHACIHTHTHAPACNSFAENSIATLDKKKNFLTSRHM